MTDTPKKTSRNFSNFKPTNIDFGSPIAPLRPTLKNAEFDYSIGMSPIDVQRIVNQSNTTNKTFHGSTLNATMSAMRGDASFQSQHSLMDAHSEHGQQQGLFKHRTDMLFTQFLEVLCGRTNETDVFDTIQDLVQVCADVLGETQKDNRSDLYGNHYGNLLWLEQEAKTWKLLYALYKDRIMSQRDMDCDLPILGGSEKEVMLQLYASNSTLREYQLIVDWLEVCYERRDGGAQVGHSTDRNVGWENTLYQLKSYAPIAFGTGTDIIKSMDPDAPIREKRPLHALDEEDNKRLGRCIFAEIRQGNINEAISLCKLSGQTWRAAILEGWRLHEDPNYDPNQSSTEKLPIEGNPRRDLWKMCAWRMADSSKYDEYTRAIVGAFCGHLESLKSLLHNSWNDLLWAYLKVQIDIRVETELRSCCMKPYIPMPDTYWDAKMSLEQIFNELLVHNDAAVRNYANSKIAIIQKYLILDEIGELLQQMRCWVDEACDEGDNSNLSSHLLRFLTHIVLFMRKLRRVEQQDTADRIIAAYVERLIKLGDAQLVAFYTASLPAKLQILLYSKFLESVKETAARKNAIEEGISVGLDIENITRHTVETIRQRMPAEMPTQKYMDSQLLGTISEFDLQKINALEWLQFVPTHCGELIWQSNAMIRTFLAENKIDCVRSIYELVPTTTVKDIFQIYGENNVPCREECAIKEFFNYHIYLIAIDRFNAWTQLYHSRPKEPELSVDRANFTERIALEHKQQNYHAEVKKWEQTLKEQTENTRDLLFNVLAFPKGGWLVDPITNEEPLGVSSADWTNRQIQMEKLRSIYIPEIVMMLHKILHLSGNYEDCVRLADDIADEQLGLLNVYTKHKLAELLANLAQSSLELLNAKLDPWGYPTKL